MKAEEQINNWFKQFEYSLEKEVPTIVSNTSIEFFKDRFHPSNMDWDNIKWKPLSPSTIKRKTNKNRILFERSNLLDSIVEKIKTRNRVTISAGNLTAPYARIHNEGLRVKGNFRVKQFTNNNFMGRGKSQLIKSHTRNIDFKMPKRQFIGHSPLLNKLIIENLTKFYNNR